MYETWKEAFDAQQSHKSDYDNAFTSQTQTGVSEIDDIPFTLGLVVWVIMGEDNNLLDYEEWATEYGVKEDGTWCAVSDSHCSCYGWEATEGSITEYDSFQQLIAADEKAAVIIKYREKLLEAYPFLKFE